MPFPHIFLSYSQADYREVAYLHKKLERAGFDVWWDQMILPGQDWTRQLQLDEAIERSNVFILCFSEKALAELNSGIDAYTFRTIINSQARKSRESFVIPIRL